MVDQEKKFYVYVLLDPRKPGEFKYEGLDFVFEYEPFYVGKGCGRRWQYHYWDFTGTNPLKERLIKKLKRLGYDKTMVYFRTGLGDTEAYDLEEDVIRKIGLKLHKAGPLTNYMISGGRSPVYVMSDETKDKIRQKALGRKASDETRAMMSVERKARYQDPEYKAKMIQIKKDSPLVQAQMTKLHEASRGVPKSEEFKEAQRVRAQTDPRIMEGLRKCWEVNRGKKHPLETILRMALDKICNRYVIVDKEGNEYIVYNLTAFCKAKGVYVTNLHKTSKNGWWAQGYKIIEVQVLPAGWEDTDYYAEALYEQELYIDIYDLPEAA